MWNDLFPVILGGHYRHAHRSAGLGIRLRRLEQRRLRGHGRLHRPDLQQHNRQRCLHYLRHAATSSVRNVHTYCDQGPERGNGNVASSPAGIDCGATCTASFASGTSITLFASPTTGRFASWTGGPCAGSTKPSCTFTLGANTTATASFASQPLTFIESTLPDGNVGADYSAFINTTGGSGTEQHRFSLVASSWPDGLQMQNFFGVQSTLIHGRPTRIQVSTLTVRVDDGAETATRTFTITINAAVTLAITLPGPTAKSGTVGQFYFQNLFASGGRTPYNWSITGGQLPPGLRIIRASNGTGSRGRRQRGEPSRSI